MKRKNSNIPDVFELNSIITNKPIKSDKDWIQYYLILIIIDSCLDHLSNLLHFLIKGRKCEICGQPFFFCMCNYCKKCRYKECLCDIIFNKVNLTEWATDWICKYKNYVNINEIINDLEYVLNHFMYNSNKRKIIRNSIKKIKECNKFKVD